MKSDEAMCSVTYHETYCAAGHEVTYIPISLWSEYWWKYKVLTSKDVAIYTDLLFFCRKSMSFTLEWYAKELKCNIPTLQHRFDNLENAELLKTIASDQQAEPNQLILIAPKLPIKNDVLRLKRQVEENHAKQSRELHGKPEKSLFHKIKLSVEKNIGLAK